MPAVIIIMAALLVGYGLLVAGTYLLAGPGWACVCGGALLVLLAIVLARGLGNAAKGVSDAA